MGLRNTAESWGWPARLLHWLMALLILGQLGLGFVMANLIEDLYLRFDLTQTHKSWGMVIFALALIRILWRAVNSRPDLPVEMKPHERTLAAGGHIALYLLMLGMPVTGWLMVSASPLQEMLNIENTVFGLFVLPDPYQPGSKPAEELFKTIHSFCGFGLAILLGVHVVAALRHQLVHRNGVLSRMILGRSRGA